MPSQSVHLLFFSYHGPPLHDVLRLTTLTKAQLPNPFDFLASDLLLASPTSLPLGLVSATAGALHIQRVNMKKNQIIDSSLGV